MHSNRTTAGRTSLLLIAIFLSFRAAFGAPDTAIAPAKANRLPAFPGAEGAGAFATGGRGGEVYLVTTLADSGPGSLRDAVKKPNRMILFGVSGTIELQAQLDVRQSNITIAGQSTPGGGICLRNFPFNVRASNVIVRYLRVRLGDTSKQESDAITIWHGSRNVIFDHCSATWSVDEALSTAGDVGDVTVQWCIIGEALRHSVHAKGNHGYGSLSRATGAVTWHHNLWVHNDARNPRLGDNYGKEPRPLFDVRNNVIYDYGSTCSGLTQGIFRANYIGNYIRPGPSSRAKTPITIGDPSELKFFLQGNLFEGNDALSADNSAFFDHVKDKNDKVVVTTVTEPFDTLPVRTTSAEQAYADVLEQVGAILPARDSVDARIIEDVRTHAGKLIDSQTEVGGWPDLDSAPSPADADHDGMPDAWETKHKLDSNDASDSAADSNGDGYSNLEEFLNSADPVRKS